METATDPGSSEWWAEQLVARLPLLRQGQNDVRFSHEVVIRTVVSELQEIRADDMKRDLRLLAAIATLDYELKTLLLRLIEDSENRLIWQKYLALVVWQALKELPRQLGQEFRVEAKTFADAVREVRKDKAFMDELALIRNSVAAHLSPPSEAPGVIEWSIDSIASHSSSTPVMNTQLAVHALTVSGAVHALGSSLLRRYPATFPDAKT